MGLCVVDIYDFFCKNYSKFKIKKNELKETSYFFRGLCHKKDYFKEKALKKYHWSKQTYVEVNKVCSIIEPKVQKVQSTYRNKKAQFEKYIEEEREAKPQKVIINPEVDKLFKERDFIRFDTSWLLDVPPVELLKKQKILAGTDKLITQIFEDKICVYLLSSENKFTTTGFTPVSQQTGNKGLFSSNFYEMKIKKNISSQEIFRILTSFSIEPKETTKKASIIF